MNLGIYEIRITADHKKDLVALVIFLNQTYLRLLIPKIFFLALVLLQFLIIGMVLRMKNTLQNI
jgi:hypothetical protein